VLPAGLVNLRHRLAREVVNCMSGSQSLRSAGAQSQSGRSSVTYASQALEKRWFQFDRNAVLHQVDNMRWAIDQDASDLEMVAAEGIFEKALCDELVRASQALHRMALEMKVLRVHVGQARGYPKT